MLLIQQNMCLCTTALLQLICPVADSCRPWLTYYFLHSTPIHNVFIYVIFYANIIRTSGQKNISSLATDASHNPLALDVSPFIVFPFSELAFVNFNSATLAAN